MGSVHVKFGIIVGAVSDVSLSPATKIRSITVPGAGGVGHISVLSSDRLWVSDDHGHLQQVDFTGHVAHNKMRVRTFEFDTESHNITEAGDLLFIDDYDQVDKLTSDGTVTTLLTTDRALYCIHSSRFNGDILVGSDGRVTRYDSRGRERQVIEKDYKGQCLYESPNYITENQNRDIWTSDWAKEAVVVVNKSGRHRFDYIGRQFDDKGHLSLKSDFSPRGICTDAIGHVLVCNYHDHSVHLLDQDGQFLSQLLTTKQHGIRYPTALCVDDQYNLYLGQKLSNKIHMYKYLQDTDVK